MPHECNGCERCKREDRIAKSIAKDKELAELRAFRDEVVAVMDNSQGVIGWHLNGDIAKWDELLPDVPY